ncbi:hypothetical protein D3C73_1007600 [compost metagenome]
MAHIPDRPFGLARQERSSAGDLSHQRLQRNRLFIKGTAGIGTRQREHVGYQTAHPFGFIGDILYRFDRQLADIRLAHSAMFWLHLPDFLQQVDVAADRRERRAQLMRGVRYKAALRGIGILQLFIESLHPAEHAVDRLDQPANFVRRAVIFNP